MATIMRNMIRKHDSFYDLDKENFFIRNKPEWKLWVWYGKKCMFVKWHRKKWQKDANKLESYFKAEQVKIKS